MLRIGSFFKNYMIVAGIRGMASAKVPPTVAATSSDVAANDDDFDMFAQSRKGYEQSRQALRYRYACTESNCFYNLFLRFSTLFAKCFVSVVSVRVILLTYCSWFSYDHNGIYFPNCQQSVSLYAAILSFFV